MAYLENQTVLSHKWILEAKQEYKVEFRILNNGKKLYFDKLDTESRNQDKKEEDLSSVGNMLTEAARISREEQGLDVDYMGSLSLSKTVYFETSDFYACTALIPKGSGALSLVLVYPLDGLKTQIFHQRVWFGAVSYTHLPELMRIRSGMELWGLWTSRILRTAVAVIPILECPAVMILQIPVPILSM